MYLSIFNDINLVWLDRVIFMDSSSKALDMSTRILSQFCPALPPTLPCHSGLNSLVLWFWLLFIWSLISHNNGQAKELPTYKDNDFINDGQKIHIDGENKKMFLEKLRKDVEVGLNNEMWQNKKTFPSVSVLTVCINIFSFSGSSSLPFPISVLLSSSHLLLFHLLSSRLPSSSVPGPAEAHGLQSAGGDPRCWASRAGRGGERGQWGWGGGRERWRGHRNTPWQSQQYPGQQQASVTWGVWSHHWRLRHQKQWKWAANCMCSTIQTLHNIKCSTEGSPYWIFVVLIPVLKPVKNI